MKILVTGASGFIGRFVIKELLKTADYQVIATSSKPETLNKIPDHPRVIKIHFDVLSTNPNKNLFEYFHKPDLLIHLAWNGLPNYMEPFHVMINLPREIDFITNLISHGLSNLAITGTCFEYGMKEGCLNEKLDCNPSNYYALAKDMLRRFLEIYCYENKICFKWIRLFYMFGEGQYSNSLFSQLDRALEEKQLVFNMSKGEQIRDYLPVEKVADNIVRISTQKKVTGIINNCSADPQKLKNIVRNYLVQKNKEINLNLGYYPYSSLEPMAFWGDNSKLKQL